MYPLTVVPLAVGQKPVGAGDADVVVVLLGVTGTGAPARAPVMKFAPDATIPPMFPDLR